MKNLYVEIRMEDMDRNKDKFLTLSEYIGQCQLPSTTTCVPSCVSVCYIRGSVAKRPERQGT